MYNLNNVITVEAMNADRKISRFSNYSSNYVDVLADGENILSKNCYNEWEYYDGTTYATVIVSALAIKGIVDEGASTPNEIKEYVIKKSAQSKQLKKLCEIWNSGIA